MHVPREKQKKYWLKLAALSLKDIENIYFLVNFNIYCPNFHPFLFSCLLLNPKLLSVAAF